MSDHLLSSRRKRSRGEGPRTSELGDLVLKRTSEGTRWETRAAGALPASFRGWRYSDGPHGRAAMRSGSFPEAPRLPRRGSLSHSTRNHARCATVEEGRRACGSAAFPAMKRTSWPPVSPWLAPDRDSAGSGERGIPDFERRGNNNLSPALETRTRLSPRLSGAARNCARRGSRGHRRRCPGVPRATCLVPPGAGRRPCAASPRTRRATRRS